MARQPWDDVFDRIRVVKSPRLLYPFRPTVSDLDAVEEELGCRFPASYRAFMQRFGAGSIEGLMRLKSLGVPAFGIPSLAEFTREWQGYIEEGYSTFAERYEAFGRRVVAIADDGGRGAFAYFASHEDWPLIEDRVYELDWVASPSDEPSLQPAPFADFLEQLRQLTRDLAASDPSHASELRELSDEIIFQPTMILSWPKRLFTKRTLNTWLTANTNAARNLALPILGDALEDAGCTDAHVLRACRDGNPQADGDWVLAVLLGAPRSG